MKKTSLVVFFLSLFSVSLLFTASVAHAGATNTDGGDNNHPSQDGGHDDSNKDDSHKDDSKKDDSHHDSDDNHNDNHNDGNHGDDNSGQNGGDHGGDNNHPKDPKDCGTTTPPVVTNTPPVITLVGANPLTININTAFTDPGATAVDAQDGNLTSHIVVTGTVNTTVASTYTITYTVKDSGGLGATTTRSVIVVNPNNGGGNNATNTPPVITLFGSNPLTINLNTAFIDPGATATDTQDGNLTSHIVATGTVNVAAVGTYTITYTVKDSGGLGATTTRSVIVVNPNNGGGGNNATNTPPVITILGNNPETIVVGTDYVDAGATATDTQDGNITSKIITSGSVATTTIGAYTITYVVTDTGGLTATSTRVVNVVAPTPTITTTGGGGGTGGPDIGTGGGYGGTPYLAAAFSGLSGGNLPAAPLSCPLLRDYLRIDFQNDPTEVVKLQAFLQRIEGYDVDITGTFDQKTLAGVNAFQTKYLGQVMGPWGASRPSGYVYITTKKKINEIACNDAFIINSAEQSVIDAYKNTQLQNGGNNSTSTNPDIGLNGSGNSTVAANGSLFDNEANTASAANSSVFARFWNFLKSLFSN